eukprot:768264-Hanusia_phi.AAC.6
MFCSPSLPSQSSLEDKISCVCVFACLLKNASTCHISHSLLPVSIDSLSLQDVANSANSFGIGLYMTLHGRQALRTCGELARVGVFKVKGPRDRREEEGRSIFMIEMIKAKTIGSGRRRNRRREGGDGLCAGIERIRMSKQEHGVNAASGSPRKHGDSVKA